MAAATSSYANAVTFLVIIIHCTMHAFILNSHDFLMERLPFNDDLREALTQVG